MAAARKKDVFSVANSSSIALLLKCAGIEKSAVWQRMAFENIESSDIILRTGVPFFCCCIN